MLPRVTEDLQRTVRDVHIIAYGSLLGQLYHIDVLGVLWGHLSFPRCFLADDTLTEVFIVNLRYVSLEALGPAAAHLLGGVNVFL